MGKDYNYGDSGPDSFDCSGLVYYCLKLVGINKGRLSSYGYSLIEEWPLIERKEDLIRGDLIFYHNGYGYINHIAVYLGNGYYIHASASNDCVIISSFGQWTNDYFAMGRRIYH